MHKKKSPVPPPLRFSNCFLKSADRKSQKIQKLKSECFFLFFETFPSKTNKKDIG
ncbi:Protein CBG26937 [Caenorhabditis briggsae]|uniref:Protein CBG26937 n=1 Tax=Caenorhabditis briggsae TaxID=6238 RepID=B6ILZ3_CAEBR|nr:Protein CBG26937 [Caenorhabditis briggsae]CAS00923.1 Protein CBG26937 [Caenorhabditis briggsae]